MVVFEIWRFKTKVIGCQSRVKFREKILVEMWRHKKKSRPQYWVLRSETESAWAQHGWFNADSMAALKTHYCGRDFFLWRLLGNTSREKKFRHRACHKKIRQIHFFLKSLFLLREVFKWYLENPLRRNKLLKKNWARLIFFWHALCLNFFPDFGLTLDADNYGLKPLIFKNYHIFGKLRTSAFILYHPT